MNIIISGCSFSLWNRQQTWANHVKNKYTNIKYHDIGQTGTSNEYLLPKLIEHVRTNEQDSLYLIQLTGLDRVVVNGIVSPTPAALGKLTKFNPWKMPDNRVNQFWINYFSNEYSEEFHYEKLLRLLIEFQSVAEKKSNIDYVIFSGWDIITNKGDSNQFDFHTPYINISNSLIKDNFETCKKLFDMINFNKFWFFENEHIQYGGITQFVQYNLPNQYWYRDIKASPVDYHPSDLGHKSFAENVIFKIIDDIL